MALELSSDLAICFKCGNEYGKYKGYFPVSYAAMHKGVGYTPICKSCVDTLYSNYLAQCNDARSAMRQVCRKLDLYWSDSIFNQVERRSSPRSIMMQYIAKINSLPYAGKSYDDTLLSEGTLWSFSKQNDTNAPPQEQTAQGTGDEELPESIDIPDEVIAFWGSGYTPEMYTELEQRRLYWMSRLPDDMEVDIGTEALIRQICPLELDINRARAAGDKNIDKLVTSLDKLIGSLGLKPGQKKQEDADAAMANTPLGVWLYRYENKRPLPEVDDDLKDVNGIRKYVFTWMGHLCKMLGLKNEYSHLYEDEIAKWSVAKPEYDGDDDEFLLDGVPSDESGGGGDGNGDE